MSRARAGRAAAPDRLECVVPAWVQAVVLTAILIVVVVIAFHVHAF